MRNTNKYTFLTICLISLLCIHCKSKRKTFYFQSIGWRVTVPAYMHIEDSATIYNPKQPGINNRNYFSAPEKTLLQVTDTGGWRLNGSSLIASIKPMEKEKSWDEILQFTRSEYAGIYNRDYLPKIKVDTVFSRESIDGKLFDKSYLKFTGPNWTQNIFIYSRLINGYEFHCVLSYPDSIKGKQFIDIFKKSSF